MRHMKLLSLLGLLSTLAACNTVGGFGQDLSETGKALDKAAYWSQNQLEYIGEEVSSDSSSSSGSSSSGYVVEEPDTMRQY